VHSKRWLRHHRTWKRIFGVKSRKSLRAGLMRSAWTGFVSDFSPVRERNLNECTKTTVEMMLRRLSCGRKSLSVRPQRLSIVLTSMTVKIGGPKLARKRPRSLALRPLCVAENASIRVLDSYRPTRGFRELRTGVMMIKSSVQLVRRYWKVTRLVQYERANQGLGTRVLFSRRPGLVG
jgi:hypothetical protein